VLGAPSVSPLNDFSLQQLADSIHIVALRALDPFGTPARPPEAVGEGRSLHQLSILPPGNLACLWLDYWL